ncbi:MAG: hypothetical protein COC19_01240 [SAR86 cluster bacterium]|uniref:Cytochrome c domain-containing protein n=1 Tax=SAR86 cluster bacterium TaxID=2030880 RepID=A0A2A4MU37_9GAMM|nr:MAG: hypothetical protein COC19_01240 [SAR86 cluster bacterium]
MSVANAWAQSEQAILENIKPVAKLCLVGQDCGNSRATASSASALAPTPVTAAVVAIAAPVVATAAAAFDAAAVYQQSCFACHGTGAAGAPKLGDADAWSARTEKGMEAMMANVINGLNAMPAKGMCFNCSDEDLQNIVEYMVSQ